MAKKHLEITNDYGNVIIDENYNVPMLILKASVVASISEPDVIPPSGYTFRYYYARTLPWRGMAKFLEGPPESFGSIFTGATTIAEKRQRVLTFNKDNIIASRCVSGTYATLVSGGLGYDSGTDTAYFYAQAYCESQNASVEIVVYRTRGIKASAFGMQIMNADDEVLFDIMRPPMIFLGSMYGALNVWNNEAGRFEMTLPSGVDQAHCFITNKSGTPYYCAYNITSNGVSWGETMFKSVMSFPTATTLRVQVLRRNAVAGTNSAFGYGGYFENVVYCPYPSGLYLEPAQL